ncbi:glycosyltransferase family 2 protein [Streptomyces zhihengii]
MDEPLEPVNDPPGPVEDAPLPRDASPAPATDPPVPDVSVVVGAYDAMPYLVRCLESVESQTIGPGRMELLAVDDGSADGTGEYLEEFAARSAVPTTVVRQPNSGGPGGPRNKGLALARGRYVFFLDADDFLGDEALERMVAVADRAGTDVVLGRMAGRGGCAPLDVRPERGAGRRPHVPGRLRAQRPETLPPRTADTARAHLRREVRDRRGRALHHGGLPRRERCVRRRGLRLLLPGGPRGREARHPAGRLGVPLRGGDRARRADRAPGTAGPGTGPADGPAVHGRAAPAVLPALLRRPEAEQRNGCAWPPW